MIWCGLHESRIMARVKWSTPHLTQTAGEAQARAARPQHDFGAPGGGASCWVASVVAVSGHVASTVNTVVQLVLVVGGSTQCVVCKVQAVPPCLVSLVCLKLVGGVGCCVVQTLAHVVCCLCTLVVDEAGHLWPTFSKQDGALCVSHHTGCCMRCHRLHKARAGARAMWLT